MQLVAGVVGREFVLVDWDRDEVVFGFGVSGGSATASEGTGGEAAHRECW